MLDDLRKLGRMVEQDDLLKNYVQFETLIDIKYNNNFYPIFSFTIGSKDPEAPTLFVTGGIHGLERVGAQLAWSLLKTTLDRLLWDKSLQELYTKIRLVIIPLTNPVGYLYYKRCNGNNVDLMRNSPVTSTEKTPFLLGGQRYSTLLPWFQGEKDKLEYENIAIYTKFMQAAHKSVCVVALDFHSGFGMKDRLWFPYSYTQSPFDQLAELNSLFTLFEETHPYHIYKIEPQSKGYLLNGDLWDYLFIELKKINPNAVFIPITLEMGSWTWVKKNPLQLFSKHGMFNPIKSHRLKRTYRRHHLLYDFINKALYSHNIWANLSPLVKNNNYNAGLSRWYD